MLSENTPVLPQGLSKSKESVPSECAETLHFGRCGIPETWTDLEGHMHRRGMPLPPRAQSDTPPRAVPALFASSWQTPDPAPAISQHRSTSMVYRHKCFRISNPTIKDEKIQTSHSTSIQQLPQQFPQLFFFPSQLSHGFPPAPQPPSPSTWQCNGTAMALAAIAALCAFRSSCWTSTRPRPSPLLRRSRDSRFSSSRAARVWRWGEVGGKILSTALYIACMCVCVRCVCV